MQLLSGKLLGIATGAVVGFPLVFLWQRLGLTQLMGVGHPYRRGIETQLATGLYGTDTVELKSPGSGW